MLAQFQQENRLEQELEETAERFTDLLYDLVSVKKMEYHQAWEMAISEILLPEESSSTRARRQALPRLPHHRRPPDRAGRPARKGPRQYRGHPAPEDARSRKPRRHRRRESHARPLCRLGRHAERLRSAIRRRNGEAPPRTLKELLTDEEYESARASTPNAHFTSPMVIEAMWEACSAWALARARRSWSPPWASGISSA